MTNQKFNRYINKQKFEPEIDLPIDSFKVEQLPPADACGAHEFDDGYLRSLNNIRTSDSINIRGYKVA